MNINYRMVSYAHVHQLTCPFNILVPRGRDPFGQHWKSRPLAWSNDIPVLNGFVNTIDWEQNQSDFSDLTQSMRRVTGSPWIADFRSWTWPEVVIFSADQKDRCLWGRECPFNLYTNRSQMTCPNCLFGTMTFWVPVSPRPKIHSNPWWCML